MNTESGDKGDFKYGDDFVHPPAQVDRALRDGDTVRLGEVVLTAYLTPLHKRGATTWVTQGARAAIEGVAAWVEPEGYRRFIAAKKRAFEDEVDAELGVAR